MGKQDWQYLQLVLEIDRQDVSYPRHVDLHFQV